MLDDHIPSQKYRDTGIFRDVISCRQLLEKYQEGQINLVTSDIASHLSSLFADSVSTIPPAFSTSNSAVTLFSTVYYYHRLIYSMLDAVPHRHHEYTVPPIHDESYIM